ncbi:MAG: 50S ribosomal protein L28 [Candidatus Nealsonbacteria bacterium]|nr:50S ribosomal protein L28 [Candidatus Nealsonbacteria bacterium]
MAKECAICGKKSIMAGQRKKLMSRYNPTPKKRKYPNLQWVSLLSNKRVKACTKCRRTMTKRT